MENLFIRVNGKKDKNTDMDFIQTLTETTIQGFLKTILSRVRLRRYSLMEPFLRELGRMGSL
jgi:hypothetical protein